MGLHLVVSSVGLALGNVSTWCWCVVFICAGYVCVAPTMRSLRCRVQCMGCACVWVIIMGLTRLGFRPGGLNTGES